MKVAPVRVGSLVLEPALLPGGRSGDAVHVCVRATENTVQRNTLIGTFECRLDEWQNLAREAAVRAITQTTIRVDDRGRVALEAAQTALYDAMNAGHLSRAYHDNVATKIEQALATPPFNPRIDEAKLAALVAAWDAIPDNGQVPIEVGAWLQPLINAVTAIVKP